MDETEKGWYVQWIDRDPRLLAMQEAAARREKADLDDEEKQVIVPGFGLFRPSKLRPFGRAF